MEIKLTTKKRQDLMKLHKMERDRRVCDRIKAVLAYDDGCTYSEIARILLLDDETIRRHIKDYLSSNKLNPENGGSESYMSKSEAKKLSSHLDGKIYLYVKDICAYARDTFGKCYSISGMTKWLHANHFCYKKPHPVPAKANKDEQTKFIKKYNKLKKKAGNKEPIYFADSVHPQHQTRLAYGWILKGIRKNIATTARQKRLNFMGAISLKGHKVVSMESDKVNAESICLFLKNLRRKHPNKCRIHIIWDNAGYHRSKAVKKQAKKLNIKVHYLPPYSPNLNPIERLWKIMHEKVTYNQYYEKFSGFTKATLGFFQSIGRQKKILRSRITDNFQLINSPMFAS